MALCEFDATPTFLRDFISSTMICAESQVFPEPGGPWMNSQLSRRFITARVASATISWGLLMIVAPGTIPWIDGGSLIRNDWTARYRAWRLIRASARR